MKRTKRVLGISFMTVNNGPGLRTLVLFKGCGLRCRWCSTPESQRAGFEVGIHRGNCNYCKRCVLTCPKGALREADGEIAIDRARCDCCGRCEDECYRDAIRVFGRDMDISEIVREIAKDGALYRHSGGGVTFSGGEPLLLDPETNRMLFAMCKERGINVGVQTCGHVPWRNVEAVLPYVDFFCWDVKHMDPDCHRELTGASSELILENLKRVSEYGIPLYLRMPVIPGCNDSDVNIIATATFAAKLDSLAAFDILPVHHLGRARYEMLDRPYPIEGVEPLPPERVVQIQALVESCGVPCGIGG